MTSGLSSDLATSDPDVARVELSNVYCPHRMRVLKRAEAFTAHHCSGGFPGLRMHLLDYGSSEVEVAPVPFEDFVLVSRPVRGRFSVSDQTRRVTSDGEAMVMDPRGEYRLHWHGRTQVSQVSQVLNIVLERQQFETAARDLLGADEVKPVHFTLGTPLSAAAASDWASVTRLLLREVVPARVGSASPLVRTQVLRLAVATLLESYPNDFLASEPATDGHTGPASVRRALAFMEGAADQDIGLADIAAAARTSVRGLQRAFRAHRDTTPLRHLRLLRLQRAHDELVAATEPGQVSIAEVAYRWGFSSPSRFAEEHRRAFGCLPSQVVRGG